MRLGIHLTRPIDPRCISDLATTLVASDLRALFVTEWPTVRQEHQPPDARFTPDGFMSLAVAAVASRELKLGTAVTVPSMRTPASLAASANSLNRISGNRFVMGVSPAPTGGEPEPVPGPDEILDLMVDVRIELGVFADDVNHSMPTIGVKTDSIDIAIRHLDAYADVWMPNASTLTKSAIRLSEHNLPGRSIVLNVESKEQVEKLERMGVRLALAPVHASDPEEASRAIHQISSWLRT